jgi:hypothetical protein
MQNVFRSVFLFIHSFLYSTPHTSTNVSALSAHLLNNNDKCFCPYSSSHFSIMFAGISLPSLYRAVFAFRLTIAHSIGYYHYTIQTTHTILIYNVHSHSQTSSKCIAIDIKYICTECETETQLDCTNERCLLEPVIMEWITLLTCPPFFPLKSQQTPANAVTDERP